MKQRFVLTALILLGVAFIAFFQSWESGRVLETSTNGQQDGAGCEDRSVEQAKELAQLMKTELSMYTSVTKDVFGKSSEGGEQTDYLLGDERKFIKQTFYAETGKSEISYYLESEKVFYFEKINTEYVVPLSQDLRGEIKNVERNEFYIGNNQNLCFWYSDGQVQLNTKAARETVEYFVSDL